MTLRFAAAALAFGVIPPAVAQDLALAAGGTRLQEPHDTSYGWLVSYSHDLAPHWSAAFTYRNEGHVPSHHRDGHSAQLWYSTHDGEGFALRGGIGPYRYFDTAVAENPFGFENAHGWGAAYSLAATWKPHGPWRWELRVDRIQARGSFDTTQAMVGATYRLNQDGSFASNATPGAFGARDHEIDVMAGQTIVNSFESQNATARLVELRAALAPSVRASLGVLSEGHAGLLDRHGVVAQLWLEPSFSGDEYTLGVGLGPYYANDQERPGNHWHALVGTTFSWHFTRAWSARITWNRVSSNYDRDSDIILLGVGYQF